MKPCWPALALSLLVLGCPGEGDKRNNPVDSAEERPSGSGGTSTAVGEGGESPADVFERAKGSFKNKDHPGYLACWTKEGQETLLSGVVMVAGLTTFGDEAKETQLNAIFSEHGIDPNQKAPTEEAFKAVEDRVALFGDLMGFIERASDDPDQFKPRGLGELTSLKVEGDRASGIVVETDEDGKPENVPFDFRRVDGRWYLDTPGGMTGEAGGGSNGSEPVGPPPPDGG